MSEARTKAMMRATVVVAMIVVVLLVAWRQGLFALEDREKLAAAIERARDVPYLVPLFVIVYAVAAAAGVPVTPLTLAGGALFGSASGIGVNWVSEMLGASLAFAGIRATGLGARAGSGLAAARSPKTLFRLRLVPVAPFSLLNAGAAVSGMSWRHFLLATAIGIVPVTIIYTVSAAQLVAGVEGSETRALATAAISATVLIAASFLPSLFKRAKPEG